MLLLSSLSPFDFIDHIKCFCFLYHQLGFVAVLLE